MSTETGTDSSFAVTRYQYNELGQLIQSTDPLNKTVQYKHDLAGNVVWQKDRNNTVTTSTYNLWGSPVVTTATSTNASDTVTRTYNSVGLPTAMTDSNGTTAYTYNGLLLPTGETRTATANSYTNSYTYNQFGNRISYTLTRNNTVEQSYTYEYDKANRLVSMNSPMGTTNYTYNANAITTCWKAKVSSIVDEGVEFTLIIYEFFEGNVSDE